jgi:hypothetical protein
MKNLYLLYFTLLSFCVLAQKKEAYAIQIQLEDAETGKNIDDAKVTLEGFEIPALTAKYDKTGKVYYFTKIPAGYNTIMAYHKKYNEKGFQNVAGLPKELKLRLQDYRYVSYSFDEPKLEQIRKNYLIESEYLENLQQIISKESSVKNENFKYLYNEDPYHIAIITKYSYKDFFANDSIKGIINKLSLEQTIYNSGTDEKRKLNCYQFGFGGFVKYEYYENEIGVSECDNNFGYSYNVFFFHKKDKTKFNRYNCKEILELRKFNLKVAVLTNKIIEYFADSKFNKDKYDRLYGYIKNSIYQYSVDNYDFGKKKSPEQIFFKSCEKEEKMYFGKERFRKLYGDESNNSVESLFFAISKDKNSSIGLGMLDELEIDKSNKEYLFTNTYKD